MAQWEEMGELFIEDEDIEEPCTEEAEIEELYATNDPIGEEPPPKVELKPLPPNLRYEFLDSNFSFPVIVNASLENDEIKKLLDMTRNKSIAKKPAPKVPQLQESKTEIDRDILLSLFKDMRATLGPVGNTRKRARRGAAAQAQQRVEVEEENEEGQENEEDQEEEMRAMPEVGGGSSSSTFEQQVLAQLAAMQLQVGQVHSQVGLLNSRMDNLETAVGRLETRNEAHAYQTWLRGQFPPGPQYYYDPAGGPPHYYDPTGGPPHFYSSAGSSQPYYGAAGGSQYYFDPAEGSQPQYDPSRGPQFPYDPTDF
nr:transmembrane protein, putative [Ipomoea batatas]